MDFNNDNHKTFTLTEAEKYLGVSRATLWRIIRQYKIPTYTDVLDRRVKRVLRIQLMTMIYSDPCRESQKGEGTHEHPKKRGRSSH